MTFPNNTYPSFVKEYAFSKSAFVSGVDSDFSVVGASAVYDGLSGVANHSYVIWGWQGVFTASGGGSGKGHCNYLYFRSRRRDRLSSVGAEEYVL